MPRSFTHTPGAVLDYQIDWSACLDTDESIAEFTVTVTSGITIVASGVSGGVITFWLAGGTVNNGYTVTCAVTTTAGRSDSRTFPVRCAQR